MNKNLLKLRKMLLALQETETDKAKLIHEGDLEIGIEVFVEDENGELVPAADGEYATEDKVIVVSEGKVAEIKDKEAEEPQSQEQLDEETEAALAEKDARIAELEAAIEAKDAELAEKDARIGELEAELEDLKSKLEESDARSAEEELKMNKQKPAKSGIKFDLFK